MASEQQYNDICPECGCVGRFLGEERGHPATRAEVWECMAENCDNRWRT